MILVISMHIHIVEREPLSGGYKETTNHWKETNELSSTVLWSKTHG